MTVFISLILWLIVLGLIWWLVDMLPLPAPVAQIIRILFIFLLIVIVLSVFGLVPGFSLPTIKIPF